MHQFNNHCGQGNFPLGRVGKTGIAIIIFRTLFGCALVILKTLI